MELAELLRIQDALDLHHTHLIFFAGDGFVIAHTVVERAREEVRSARPARRGSPRPDLERCRLHAWASELDLEARWSGSGLWRLGYGSPTTPWPNLVALDILSRSPHPRPWSQPTATCG